MFITIIPVLFLIDLTYYENELFLILDRMVDNELRYCKMFIRNKSQDFYDLKIDS